MAEVQRFQSFVEAHLNPGSDITRSLDCQARFELQIGTPGVVYPQIMSDPGGAAGQAASAIYRARCRL